MMSWKTLILQIFIPLAVCGLWGAKAAMRVHHNFHSQHAEDLRLIEESAVRLVAQLCDCYPVNTIAMRVPTTSPIR